MIFSKTSIRTLLLALLVLTFVLPISTNADTYPKLANYYLNWDMTDEQARELAQWDIVVISPQALDRNPDVIQIMRAKNPDIKVLAYVVAEEMNPQVAVTLAADDIWKQIYTIADARNWWLRSSAGAHVSQWPATWMINSSAAAPSMNGENYANYLPGLVALKILYPGSPWDGVFYDNMFPDVSWVNGGDIDTNADGIRDDAATADEAWRAGMRTIAQKTRALAPGKIIIGNTRHNTYTPVTNGRLHENFPEYPRAAWAGAMREFVNNNIGYKPNVLIINKSSDKPFDSGDFSSMRFGLASALMGDGFYSYDWGQSHNELWWYDEYGVYMGNPTGEAKNLLGSSGAFVPSVWRRDFTNAVAVVNSTEQDQKLRFNEDLEKIKGVQDPATNNGAIIRTLTLKSGDGAVLIRRIQEIIGGVYQNGSFVRVFNSDGTAERNGFFATEDSYAGGVQIIKKDINGGGQLEIVVADASRVTVYDINGKKVASWYPYGTAYKSGVTMDVADIDNNGTSEIITGTGRGGKPEVKIFDTTGKQIGKSFFAYAKNYFGGVNIAVCDLNGNGNKQIVTGAGHLGGPQVRIFSPDGKVLSGGFFAYAPTFRGGVYVSCGDVNGDKKDEIITGAGYSGSSHVRLFNGQGKAVSPGFFAFGQDVRTGVRVFSADLNGDGIEEILAAAPNT